MFLMPLSSPEPMHIPDGFLSVLVSIVLWIVSILVVAYALKRVNQDLGERQVPLMGVVAAAIFAGQMLNFTVVGGTSGHLMGAALATILLGPWAAILVMTTVVSVQALIFQDGGLLVLGAKSSIWAIIGVAVSYFVYTTIRRLAGEKRLGHLCWLASWPPGLRSLSPALAVALELAFSGTSPANIAVPGHGRHPCLDRHRRRPDHRRRAGADLCRPPGSAEDWSVSARPAGRPCGWWAWPLPSPWPLPLPWPPPTPMAWNGSPGNAASWIAPRGRFTRSSPITFCPGFLTKPWPPSWPASSAR